jgi:hypothetical protein
MNLNLLIFEGKLTLINKEICRLRESETKEMTCKFFSKKGGCKHGSTCRFSHATLEGQKDKELALRQSSKVKKKPQVFSNTEILKFLLSMDVDTEFVNANFIPAAQLEEFLNEANEAISNPSLASIGRNFCLQKNIDISSLPLIFQDFLNKGASKKRAN